MKKKAFAVYVLLFLLAFLSLGAFVGGIPLLIDPTGDLLKLPISLLEDTPFSSFFIPGLILTLVFGIFPLIVGYALIKMPQWKRVGILNILPDMYWAWTYTIYIGFGQILWISIQTVLINEAGMVHLFYTLLGTSIVGVALLTPIRTNFNISQKAVDPRPQ